MRAPTISLTLLLAFLLALVSMGTENAYAFTPKTRALVVERATSLMPHALRRQMKRHSRALYSGALEGVDLVGPGHAALDPGRADQELAAAIDEVTLAIESRQPMREIARRFGRVARLTSDLSFALHVGPSDPRESGFYLDYARFVESRLSRIRVTFDGFADPRLARGDVPAFARAVGERARRDYDGIVRSYHPEGRRSVSADFDDRSIAFASASLEVSLAVTATAKAWIFAWHRANGDLAGAHVASPDAPFGPVVDLDAAAGRTETNREEDER